MRDRGITGRKGAAIQPPRSSDEQTGRVLRGPFALPPLDPPIPRPLDPGCQGTGGVRGSSFADHNPLLKSVKRMCPFHGIAFITNEAFAV